MFEWSDLKVVVTGGAGFLGQVVCQQLADKGCQSIGVPRRADYDLTGFEAVVRMYEDFNPDIVLHLAAEVGGIGANQAHPGRFFYANAAMGLHLIEQARIRGIKKFVQVGTVCAYPKHTPVPFKEDDLWAGYPEETNAPYGIAKKSLFVMLDAYRQEYGLKSAVVVPVNLYGPGDNFDPASSHVIPALIRKCLEAKDAKSSAVKCWGTGAASREFLYVDDAASGVLAAAQRMDDPTPINLGTGQEITIRSLAQKIAVLCDYHDELVWDPELPDGQPRRCLDTTKARKLLDWGATTNLESGLRKTIAWYCANAAG